MYGNGEAIGHDYGQSGNRLNNGSNAYAYVANSNRMDARKGITLSRDAAGNHTSNGLGQTYAWDGHGHLSQFSLNGVQKATYFYNYQHQRTHKTQERLHRAGDNGLPL
ncbi:MAG: hypothetical protein HZT40_19610 [Candidatus Thiothrix singaporensis]|uniref:RHS repeat-associated core domain-containing protein n=1 Tax=Candidatus Thiothrix singaporensis TaxID=2799669 RepID=A0A7L6AWE2_9GAMM|nr:MAG: hypothetical protein HZT40_19610 [Candidatus Thiothrix singaporensis]